MKKKKEKEEEEEEGEIIIIIILFYLFWFILFKTCVCPDWLKLLRVSDNFTDIKLKSDSQDLNLSLKRPDGFYSEIY